MHLMVKMVKTKNYFRLTKLLGVTKPLPQIMNQRKRTILSSIKTEEFSHDIAKIIGIVMSHYSQVMDEMTSSEAYAFIQMYSLKKGIREFGDKGNQA
eukprot:6866382-Ditylum_brightwellii.AAC.1